MLRTLAQGTIDDIAPGSVPPVPPPTCSGRLVVDVCCGVCSVGYAHFLEDPAVRILAIDIFPGHVFWAAILAELHLRIRYIQEDMIRLTVNRLDALLREQWNAKVEDVDHCHRSPMCDSMWPSKIKAALSTHCTCSHYSFKQIGHLTRLQPSCSKPELDACPGA